jgi:hypothetical protein
MDYVGVEVQMKPTLQRAALHRLKESVVENIIIVIHHELNLDRPVFAL